MIGIVDAFVDEAKSNQKTKPIPNGDLSTAIPDAKSTQPSSHIFWEAPELRSEMFRFLDQAGCAKCLVLSKPSFPQVVNALYEKFTHSNFLAMGKSMVPPNRMTMYFSAVRQFTITVKEAPGCKWTYEGLLNWFPSLRRIAYGKAIVTFDSDQVPKWCNFHILTGFVFDQDIDLPEPVPPFPTYYPAIDYTLTIDQHLVVTAPDNTTSIPAQPFPWINKEPSTITPANFLRLPINILIVKGDFSLDGILGLLVFRQSIGLPPIRRFDLTNGSYNAEDVARFIDFTKERLRKLSLRSRQWPTLYYDELWTQIPWKDLPIIARIAIDVSVAGNHYPIPSLQPQPAWKFPWPLELPSPNERSSGPLHLSHFAINLLFVSDSSKTIPEKVHNIARITPCAEDLALLMWSIGGPLCRNEVKMVCQPMNRRNTRPDDNLMSSSLSAGLNEQVRRELARLAEDTGPVGWRKVERQTLNSDEAVQAIEEREV